MKRLCTILLLIMLIPFPCTGESVQMPSFLEGADKMAVDMYEDLYTRLSGEIAELKSSLRSTDSFLENLYHMYNYDYDTDCNLEEVPGSDGDESVGIQRSKTRFILNNTESVPAKDIFFKISGEVERTTDPDVADAWPGISFESGHTYRITTEIVSGSVVSGGTLSGFTTRVCLEGTHDQVADHESMTRKNIATFTAEGDSRYVLLIKASAGTVYNQLVLNIVAEDMTSEFEIASKNGMSRESSISSEIAIGDDWRDHIVPDPGAVYAQTALDVGDAAGEKIVIRIGTEDAHSGMQVCGFCNEKNKVSSVYAEKTLSFTDDGNGMKAELPITDRYFFFSCSYKSALTISIQSTGDVEPIDVAYVATYGDDANDGSKNHPFATVNKALESGASQIYLRGGVYYQTVNLSLSGKRDFSIVNLTAKEKVIFKAPDCLVTDKEELLPGYTKVYSARTTKTFQDKNVWLFQDGVDDESTHIADEDRMPEQRGYVVRCSDTKIERCTATELTEAIVEIEYTDGYKWFADGDMLYFSRPEPVTAAHPICGSFNERFFSDKPTRCTLKMTGIDIRYMGLNLTQTAMCTITDCSVANVFGAGCYTFDGASGLELIRCEASRCFYGTNGDGFNAHSVLEGDAFARQTVATLVDCWSHDNRDDGISTHERSEFTVIGGLFEHNMYGGGVTPAGGAHCVCIGSMARYNGEGGFLYMNPALESEGGVGGQFKCIGCIAMGNATWDEVDSAGYKINASKIRAILIDCKAIGEENGYYVSSDSSDMQLYDCTVLDCLRVKGGKTGRITVHNTEKVQ